MDDLSSNALRRSCSCVYVVSADICKMQSNPVFVVGARGSPILNRHLCVQWYDYLYPMPHIQTRHAEDAPLTGTNCHSRLKVTATKLDSYLGGFGILIHQHPSSFVLKTCAHWLPKA